MPAYMFVDTMMDCFVSGGDKNKEGQQYHEGGKKKKGFTQNTNKTAGCRRQQTCPSAPQNKERKKGVG